MKYILTFDVGTTFIKGALYGIADSGLQLIKIDKEKISLYVKDKLAE